MFFPSQQLQKSLPTFQDSILTDIELEVGFVSLKFEPGFAVQPAFHDKCQSIQ